MLVLANTTDTIKAVLGGSITTNQLQVISSWRDITTSAYTPGRTVVDTNDTTAVDIVAAPSASTQRVVDSIICYNSDTVSALVTITYDANGDSQTIWKGTLRTGWSVQYENGYGWSVRDNNGILITTPAVNAAPSSVLMNPAFATANLTGTKTITSGSSFAVYVGKAPRALTSVTLRCRVTTGMGTITWGEVAIAKGTINVGGNPTLTVVGYTDVSATYNGTGQKSTTIAVSSGQQILEGDDLWVLIGNAATTACVVRAQSIADDIQVGLQGSAAQRPSSILGNPTVFTIEGATTLAPWVALVI